MKYNRHVPSFSQFINEASIILEGKQVGPLYHVMDHDKFKSVITTDKLGKPTSFTRNKDYDSVVGRGVDYAYQIKVDGDKLSNNFKIHPVNTGGGWVKDEFEELVDDMIPNIGKYITEIIVIAKSRQGKYTKHDYHSRSYYHKSYEELSGVLEAFMKKYPNIELKVKWGHRGKISSVGDKEAKWLKSMGILNPKESELSSICGLYKDKKLLISGQLESNALNKYITKNGDKFVVNYQDQLVKVSELKDTGDPWDSAFDYAQDPFDFVVDENNNYVILQQVRNTNNQIIVQILHSQNTVKDLEYYRELVAGLGKPSVAIDPQKEKEEYYKMLDGDE